MRKYLTRFTAVLILLSSNSVFSNDTEINKHQFISPFVYSAVLSGAQEVTDPKGGVETDRRGRVFAVFDAGFKNMRVRVRLSSGKDVVAMHFHCGRAGQNGPLALGLFSPGPLTLNGKVVVGKLTNSDVLGEDCDALIGQPINNLVSLAAAMKAGLIYLNVHTIENPPGELRGQLSVYPG